MQDYQTHESIENRLDVSRQLLTSELSVINASVAQIINLTSDSHNTPINRRASEYNHSLGAAVSTITNNLNEFRREMEIFTSLTSDKIILMDQTNRLCSTFNELLTQIEALSDNHSDSSIRQNILLVASRLGEITQDLARRLANDLTTNIFDVSVEYQDKLLSLAKTVANTTASYVLKAKQIATNISNQNDLNEIIGAATQCALATSQLVACTKVCSIEINFSIGQTTHSFQVVAATISNPLCQEQLIESARSVTRSVESVVQSCSPPITTETSHQELTEGATVVRKALNDFLLHIKLVTDSVAEANGDHNFDIFSNTTRNYTTDTRTTTTITRRTIADDEIEEVDEEQDDDDERIQENQSDKAIDQILLASDRLFSSVGDATEMVRQAKVLAQATANLVSSLRHQAEIATDDTNEQKKLLSAAKMLADATARMVESAKNCASQPNDTQLQYDLKTAAEELRFVLIQILEQLSS